MYFMAKLEGASLSSMCAFVVLLNIFVHICMNKTKSNINEVWGEPVVSMVQHAVIIIQKFYWPVKIALLKALLKHLNFL